MDALDHHLGALTIVPPIGLGLSFLTPSLVLCVALLIGVLSLALWSVRRSRWNLIAPTLFGLLSLTVILAAVLFWRVLV